MNENVTVCITPKGEKPVLHFSQFDNENVFTVTVLADDGESAAVLTGLDIEFRLRKTDSHVVTIAPESVADNVITFKTTEQLCACCGQNIASVVLMKDDMNISTLDILVDIQRDILSGGLTSESDIRNLTTQIEQIVPEVLGDDYYNKQEVDELLAEHTFDPTNYYDKSDVDTLLADKADADDVYEKSDVYNKTETDNLLADKADCDDVYTKAETDSLLADKADSDDVMTKVTRHGLGGDVSYFSFDNNCVAPMDNIECAIAYIQSGSGTPAPDNVRPITGHSSCTITVADSDDTPVNTCTVNFGQTVYDGEVDVTGGKVVSTMQLIDFANANFVKNNPNPNDYLYYMTLGTIFDKNGHGICSHLEEKIQAPTGSTPGFYISSQFNVVYINVGVLDQNDVAGFKAFCAANDVQLLLELLTPAEVTFTPATTDTINGHNKVSSSTGNMKSLTYFSDVNSDLVDLIRACMI